MKILILRFSSIGDIVLTTPLLRCLNFQRSDIEIHYLLKVKYIEILEFNPYIYKIHSFDKSINEVVNELRNEKFDLIIDLHNNLRTKILKIKLNVKSHSFPKLNLYKWIFVNFKINLLPDIHIVDRYFDTLKTLSVIPDDKSCDYFIDKNVLSSEIILPKNYIAISLGAQFYTKQIPENKIREIISLLPDFNFVFLGDKNDFIKGENLINSVKSQNLINLCGKLKLNDSVKVLKNSSLLITGDSGLMHIASCFGIKIISIWGNTVPSFGMYPYYPKQKKLYNIFEVSGLKCRPCSKIGYSNCPKKHFNCMQKQNINEIVQLIKNHFETS